MRTRLSLFLAALFLISTVLPAAAAPGVTDSEALQQLAAVRRATTKYHDLNVALADGFGLASGCEAIPAGAMGFHYLNFARFGQIWAGQQLDILEPVALLYAPSPRGPRLVAVEYLYPIVLASGQVWTANEPPVGVPLAPAPALFGRTFDGPMAGHSPTMPAHYDLHVWVWQANPNGLLSQWNPTFNCG